MDVSPTVKTCRQAGQRTLELADRALAGPGDCLWQLGHTTIMVFLSRIDARIGRKPFGNHILDILELPSIRKDRHWSNCEGRIAGMFSITSPSRARYLVWRLFLETRNQIAEMDQADCACIPHHRSCSCVMESSVTLEYNRMSGTQSSHGVFL